MEHGSLLILSYSIVDIISISILVLILLGFGSKRLVKVGFEQRLFNTMVIVNIIALVFDIFMWLLDGRPGELFKNLNYVSTTVYYLCQIVMCYVWLLYCDYQLNDDKSRLYRRAPAYAIPLLAMLVGSVASCHTGWFFVIDEGNNYSRGDYFFVIAVISIWYIVYAAFLTLKLTWGKDSEDVRTLKKYFMLFPVFPIVGMVVQGFCFGVSVVWSCTMIALLMIYSNLHNKQLTIDELTGISNRMYFEKHVDGIVRAASKINVLFLIVLDIDDFKRINDTCGHQTGDKALVIMANILKNCIEHDDFLARFGGDEFVIVGTRRKKQAVALLEEKISDALLEFNAKGTENFELRMSHGTSYFGEDGITTLQDFFRVADQKMYEEKKNKKTR